MFRWICSCKDLAEIQVVLARFRFAEFAWVGTQIGTPKGFHNFNRYGGIFPKVVPRADRLDLVVRTPDPREPHQAVFSRSYSNKTWWP